MGTVFRGWAASLGARPQERRSHGQPDREPADPLPQLSQSPADAPCTKPPIGSGASGGRGAIALASPGNADVIGGSARQTRLRLAWSARTVYIGTHGRVAKRFKATDLNPVNCGFESHLVHPSHRLRYVHAPGSTSGRRPSGDRPRVRARLDPRCSGRRDAEVPGSRRSGTRTRPLIVSFRPYRFRFGRPPRVPRRW